LFRQSLLKQSLEFKQACPVLHGGQDPPQSTSISSLSMMTLWHKTKGVDLEDDLETHKTQSTSASVGDAAGAGVGDLEGLSIGCTVGGGFVSESSVGAFVDLQNHSKEGYDKHKLPLLLNEGPMDNQSEAYDEYRLLSLNGPIELMNRLLSLNGPIEPTELKELIEENAEAYDESPLKSEAYDECKLLLPSPDELMEELTNKCTLIDDPVDTEEENSKAYDEYKLRRPSSNELMELTNVENKVGDNVGGKVGTKVGDNVGSTAGTEQRQHVRRQKELSNSLTSSRHSASSNSSTHDDEVGFVVCIKFGSAVGRLEGPGVDCATNVIVK
jgi:hypothetical protein